VHERTFGYSYRGKQIVEIVNLRVQAIGETFRPSVGGHRAATTAARPGVRRVFFRKLGWSESPIHQRLDLSVGGRVVGPAVIEEYGSTIVIYPDWQAEVDPHWNLKMVRC
jgi:N-methylhydantoinase A